MKKLISFLCVMTILLSITMPVSAAKKDTKAPIITKTSPIDFGTDIMIESTIVVRFSEAIAKGKNFSKITIKESETKSVSYTCSIKDNLLKITPKANLKYDTSYTVTIPAAAIKDGAGNALKAAHTFSFITEKNPAKVTAGSGSKEAQYVLEIGVILKEELTEAKLAYLSQLLDKFGITTTNVNIYEPQQSRKAK
jgi:hypothetical protein